MNADDFPLPDLHDYSDLVWMDGMAVPVLRTGMAEAYARATLRSWLAAHPGGRVVSEGWKLVPIEPTPAMRKAAADAWLDCGNKLTLNKAASAVKAAIAAAPRQDSERWISVEERLPKHGDWIIGAVFVSGTKHAMWDEQWDESEPTGLMTHWHRSFPPPASQKEQP